MPLAKTQVSCLINFIHFLNCAIYTWSMSQNKLLIFNLKPCMKDSNLHNLSQMGFLPFPVFNNVVIGLCCVTELSKSHWPWLSSQYLVHDSRAFLASRLSMYYLTPDTTVQMGTGNLSAGTWPCVNCEPTCFKPGGVLVQEIQID